MQNFKGLKQPISLRKKEKKNRKTAGLTLPDYKPDYKNYYKVIKKIYGTHITTNI